MVVFVQVLDEIEERGKRLDSAPPPPAVSFIEPPEPAPAHPRAAVDRVAAAYRKMQYSSSSPHVGLSIDDGQ